MKALLKIAMMSAVAGVLVNMLLKRQRSSRETATSTGTSSTPDAPASRYGRNQGTQVADTNAVHGGDPAREQRGPQPQDWRGAQNVLE